MMTELTAGVTAIATPLANRRNDVYAFAGPTRTVLFDTGVDGVADSHILPGLDQAGVPAGSVSHVVVSHCDVDHFGGLAAAHRAFPSAAFLAHAADAPMMADFSLYLAGRGRSFVSVYGLDEPAEDLAWVRSVTREAPLSGYVAGGESIDLGDRELRVLHLPGHSRGHLGIHDPQRDLLAVSDAVLGVAVPDSGGAPIFPPTYRHVDDYLATIALVRRLAPRILATAHYGTFEGAAVTDFLDASEEFCRELEVSVRDVFAERDSGSGLTLEECVRQLLGPVGTWPREGRLNALAFPVCGHIERLAARGVLQVDLTSAPARIRVAA